MTREAPRTLYKLTSQYQNLDEKDYEVIAIDNGSTIPLDERIVCSMGSNFRSINIENAAPSPALALNEGARFASERLLGFMVDGARMLSPEILKYTLHALRAFHNPVVYTLGFHLGPDFQPKAIEQGYDQKQEDKLLKGIKWRENGYMLFDISVFAASSMDGWSAP